MQGKNSDFSSLGKPRAEGRTFSIQVPIRRLDDIVSEALVDVVKIDVEGAELGVLQGAEKIIGVARPTIAFESDPEVDDGLPYSNEDPGLGTVNASVK